MLYWEKVLEGGQERKRNLCIKGVLERIEKRHRERKREREKSLLPGSLARLGLLLLLVG